MSVRRARTIGASVVLLGAVCCFYRFVFDGQVLVASDYFRLFIPESSLLLDSLRAGEWPLWNPYARLGQPFAASMQAQVFYPPRVMAVALFGAPVGMTVLQMLHAFIAGLGVVWLLSAWVKRWPSAWVAGAAFSLSPMFTSLASPNIAAALAWSGWIVGAAVRSRWRVLAVTIALSLLSASPETTLWQLFFALLLAGRDWRVVACALLGGGLAAQTLIPAVEMTASSIRGSQSLTPEVWSVSWAQVVAGVWPMFDQPRGAYWGDDQHLLPSMFLGTVPVVLAAVGALGGHRKARVLFVGSLVLLIFSLGAHVLPVKMLLGLPPFSWFRYPAKAWPGVAFGVAVLAGLGVDGAARLARRLAVRPRWAIGVVVVVVVARLATLPLLSHLREYARDGSSWPLLAVGAVALLFCMLPGGVRRGRTFAWAVCIACLVELALARMWITELAPDPLSTTSAPSSVAARLPQPFTGRVSAGIIGAGMDFPPDGGELTTISRELLVPVRFIEERVEAVEGFGPPEPARVERLLRGRSRGFYDLAGVTHFLREKSAPFNDLRKLRELEGGAGLFASDTALPRAFVVQHAVVVSDDEALLAIESPDAGQPFRHTAFLAEGEAGSSPPCNSEVVRGPCRLSHASYDVRACDDGYLVMTDSYAPGWTARVDDEEVPVRRVDYAFRAVRLTRGPHHVRLSYRPWRFFIGLIVSLLSALLLLHPVWRSRA